MVGAYLAFAKEPNGPLDQYIYTRWWPETSYLIAIFDRVLARSRCTRVAISINNTKKTCLTKGRSEGAWQLSPGPLVGRGASWATAQSVGDMACKRPALINEISLSFQIGMSSIVGLLCRSSLLRAVGSGLPKDLAGHAIFIWAGFGLEVDLKAQKWSEAPARIAFYFGSASVVCV